MTEYPFADDLQSACKFCATIARAKLERWWTRNLIPKPDDPTATVTFIRIQGRTYAVTAWHVIKIFREAAEQDGAYPESYFLPARPGVLIGPPFVQAPKPWTAPRPDIGLRPVHPDLPGRIGKEFFELRPAPAPTFPLRYALAVGYPTLSKTVRPEPQGKRIAMQCVHAVAEGVGSGPDSDQVQFLSSIQEQPSTDSLSGLSGGPVFWSDGNAYGLLGFVKEAMDVKPREGEATLYTGPRVHFLCQRADYQTFLEWSAYADDTFAKERDFLNRLANEITAQKAHQ
jgi:hypothetical protein